MEVGMQTQIARLFCTPRINLCTSSYVGGVCKDILYQTILSMGVLNTACNIMGTTDCTWNAAQDTCFFLACCTFPCRQGAQIELSFEAHCVGMDLYVDCVCNESLLCRQLDQQPALSCCHLHPAFTSLQCAAT